MGSLPGHFRRRLRDLLETQSRAQAALATYLHLDQGRVSKILKHDAAAGTVTVHRLEEIGRFFQVPPVDLLRSPGAMPLELSDTESELIGLVRLLPQPQQENLVTMLDYFFKPRREAQAEKRALAMLRTSMERQLAGQPSTSGTTR